MVAVRHLHLEGHLVATAEVVDPYPHDRDEWHNLFVFPADDGYTLVSMARYESYSDRGGVERGFLDITVDHPGDIRQLEELVSGRHRVTSGAWWQTSTPAAITTLSFHSYIDPRGVRMCRTCRRRGGTAAGPPGEEPAPHP